MARIDVDRELESLCRVGDFEAVERLLCAARLQALPCCGSLGLSRAIRCGHDPVVRRILAHKPELANEAFLIACSERLSTVRVAVANGAEVNFRSTSSNNRAVPDWSGLMRAAARGLEDVVSYLLEARADPHQRDLNGLTALHHACLHAQVGTARLLLEAGCDPNATDLHGYNTPLVVLTRYPCCSAIISQLASKGADLGRADPAGNCALTYAAKYSNLETVKSLVALGCDVNTRNNAGLTPLAYVRSLPEIARRTLTDQVAEFLESQGGTI